MKLVAQEAAKNLSVRSGGYMILMQEQDSFGKLLFYGISQIFPIFIKQMITKLYCNESYFVC